MNEEIVSEEVLRQAKLILKSDAHTSRVETLALAVCILLEGVVDTLLAEYEPEDAT